VWDASGCNFEDPETHQFVIELLLGETRARPVFYHELGHIWDQLYMQPWQRERFEVLRHQTGIPWDYEPETFLKIEQLAPREWFANSYALCAELPTINPRWVMEAGGLISGRTLRKVCGMISRTPI
jgi:hypothetical protein